MRDIRTHDDLDWLITDSIEESTILEFKCMLPRKPQESKNNSKFILSKAISALANTKGGQIIIGMKEEKDIAKEIEWIDERQYKQTLDSWINDELDPAITDYELNTIKNRENDSSVYVIKINKSRKGPHQANNGVYYKRVETSSISMSDYEVKDAMFRSGLIEALIQELIDNYIHAKELKDNENEFKHLYNEGNPPSFPIVIRHFDTEIWKVIISSGFFSVVSDLCPRILKLYSSIKELNTLIDIISRKILRAATKENPKGEHIFNNFYYSINNDIISPLEEIIKTFGYKIPKV